MSPTFHQRLLTSQAIDAADASTLVASARALRNNAAAQSSRLRGRNIALLCAEPACASARQFDAAASALGARVAHIQPTPSWLQDDPPIGEQTARLLEHLYDAVDCEQLPPDFARRLQARLSLPVYDGLASEDHPIFGLLPQLATPGHVADDDDRRALVQAALLGSLP